MQRKWTVLVVLTAAFAASAGLIRAEADDESPLGKMMEKINKQNNVIKKATRTAPAFKKAGMDVVKAATELTKLAKEAKKDKGALENADKEKVKDPAAEWDKLSDEFIASTEKLTEQAEKGDLAATKSALATVGKACSSCHGVFRKEDD